MTREELEWSLQTPITRRNGTKQCPYCGHSQTYGHHPDCAFLDPNKTTEDIQNEIQEAERASREEIARLWGLGSSA